MKKTTDLAPLKTHSSLGQPPVTSTGSTPGADSFRHLTSSFVPALNSCSPGPWLGVPAITTTLAASAASAATGPREGATSASAGSMEECLAV